MTAIASSSEGLQVSVKFIGDDVDVEAASSGNFALVVVPAIAHHHDMNSGVFVDDSMPATEGGMVSAHALDQLGSGGLSSGCLCMRTSSAVGVTLPGLVTMHLAHCIGPLPADLRHQVREAADPRRVQRSMTA
jgi:hypothetical protein